MFATFPPGLVSGAVEFKPASGISPPSRTRLPVAGVGLGCVASGATLVTDDMMLAAARAVTGKLTNDELAQTSILPSTERLRLAVTRFCQFSTHTR